LLKSNTKSPIPKSESKKSFAFLGIAGQTLAFAESVEKFLVFGSKFAKLSLVTFRLSKE